MQWTSDAAGAGKRSRQVARVVGHVLAVLAWLTAGLGATVDGPPVLAAPACAASAVAASTPEPGRGPGTGGDSLDAGLGPDSPLAAEPYQETYAARASWNTGGKTPSPESSATPADTTWPAYNYRPALPPAQLVYEPRPVQAPPVAAPDATRAPTGWPQWRIVEPARALPVESPDVTPKQARIQQLFFQNRPAYDAAVTVETALDGSTISVAGCGFRPNEKVSIWLDVSSAALAHRLRVADVDAGTAFRADGVTVPPGVPAGTHTIDVIGDTSGHTVMAFLVLE